MGKKKHFHDSAVHANGHPIGPGVRPHHTKSHASALMRSTDVDKLPSPNPTMCPACGGDHMKSNGCKGFK